MAPRAVARITCAWRRLPAYERAHALRVARLAVQLGVQLGLNERELKTLWRGAILHDIGKAFVSRTILLKPEPLNEEERALLRLHPQMGYDLLAPLAGLRDAKVVVLHHHECWDGKGYPYQLSGEAIPVLARIVAVVDVWDALSACRPYSRPWPEAKTREYIARNAVTHFNPKIVAIFLRFPIGRGALTLPSTQVLCKPPMFGK